MIRGDVYWHKFKEPDKTRPVLIVTRDEALPELNYDSDSNYNDNS